MKRSQADERLFLNSHGTSSEGTCRGWALPPLVVAGKIVDERPNVTVDTAKLVLSVVPGERPLEPEFGCRLHFIADLSQPTERTLAGALVEEALERWVPHLKIDAAEVVAVEGNEVRLRLRSHYIWHDVAIRHRRAPLSAVPETVEER